MNQKENALLDYDKAIEINPDYSNAYLNRSLKYLINSSTSLWYGSDR